MVTGIEEQQQQATCPNTGARERQRAFSKWACTSRNMHRGEPNKTHNRRSTKKCKRLPRTWNACPETRTNAVCCDVRHGFDPPTASMKSLPPCCPPSALTAALAAAPPPEAALPPEEEAAPPSCASFQESTDTSQGRLLFFPATSNLMCTTNCPARSALSRESTLLSLPPLPSSFIPSPPPRAAGVPFCGTSPILTWVYSASREKSRPTFAFKSDISSSPPPWRKSAEAGSASRLDDAGGAAVAGDEDAPCPFSDLTVAAPPWSPPPAAVDDDDDDNPPFCSRAIFFSGRPLSPSSHSSFTRLLLSGGAAAPSFGTPMPLLLLMLPAAAAGTAGPGGDDGTTAAQPATRPSRSRGIGPSWCEITFGSSAGLPLFTSAAVAIASNALWACRPSVCPALRRPTAVGATPAPRPKPIDVSAARSSGSCAAPPR